MQHNVKYTICYKVFVVNFVFVEYISTTVGTCISGIAILLYIDEFVLLGGVT